MRESSETTARLVGASSRSNIVYGLAGHWMHMAWRITRCIWPGGSLGAYGVCVGCGESLVVGPYYIWYGRPLVYMAWRANSCMAVAMPLQASECMAVAMPLQASECMAVAMRYGLAGK